MKPRKTMRACLTGLAALGLAAPLLAASGPQYSPNGQEPPQPSCSAFAYSPSKLKHVKATFTGKDSSGEEALRDAIKYCAEYLKADDCAGAGWTDSKNWLALAATSTPNGPWGYQRAKKLEDASKGAVKWCVHYGGNEDDCEVIAATRAP